VPPGGAGEIKATFKSKGYNGAVRKTVTVETNDPKNRTVQLSLAGKVVAEVTVDPRFVNFGNVQRDGPRKPVTLQVEFQGDKKIKIKEIRSESDAVEVTPVKEGPGGAEYAVSLKDKVPTGRIAGQIFIRTTSKKTPQIQVPVHAFVQGSVKVTPQLLSFGAVSPGTPVTRQLTVARAGAQPFSVKDVRKSSNHLSSQVIPEKEGEQYRIEVVFDPGDQKEGRIAERLTIVAEGGEEETIEVPVYGIIRAAPASPNR